jgi:hypothetical protein
MLAIMHTLTKFRQYLVVSKFIVKTNDNTLKYVLEQKDLSELQQKWVTKVLAFDFDTEYVKGKKNIVADALSRRLATYSLMDVQQIGNPICWWNIPRTSSLMRFWMGRFRMKGIGLLTTSYSTRT